MMLIPDPQVVQTESGGDRHNRDLQALWDRREPAPFYADPEEDQCADVPCIVCDASLHRYEVDEHQEACKKILASDGKDRQFPGATKEKNDDKHNILC